VGRPHRLRVQIQRRSEIVSQNDAHIHTPEGVCLDHDVTRAQHSRHCARPRRITSPDDYPSQDLSRVSVAQEHDIHSMRPEHSRSSAGDSLAASAVQNFHHKPAVYRRNGRGRCDCRLAPTLEEERAHSDQQNDSRCQREPGPAATKLFQNRTVGSRIGHPLLMRWRIREWATSRRTPPGSLGSRLVRSARPSRSKGRSGSR
jgi:hypothetical protein